MAFQCLLFDLDGTLTDPLLGISRSINYALEAHGFKPRSEVDLATCIGPPLEGSFSELSGSNDKHLIAGLVSKYRERYLDVGFAENKLYPGVIEALLALESADQRLALCTSKPERTARMVLHLFKLEHFFEFVSGGDIGVAKWMQIEALLANNAIGKHSVMIGDRGVDLQAGHKNDVAAGAVLWGYGSREELKLESPEFYFNSPNDWISLLD